MRGKTPSKTASWFPLAVFLCLVTTVLQAADELVIASPHWEGIQHEFSLAFEAHYQKKHGRPVKLRWRDLGGASQIEKAVDAIYKVTPNTCGMDVFFGGGMDPFENQHKKGQLHPYRLPEELLAQLPHEVQGVELIGPDYAYYGAALSSFGIVENRRVIAQMKLPEVRTWEDLTRPELFGWVSSADPRKSGSVHMIYEVILQAYGWDRGWQVIYGMSGNVRSFLQASSGPTKEVSVGDAAFAPSIDINGLTQQAFLGRENVRFLIPQGVSVITPDGIGIFKGAPNLEIAKEFVNFVLSPRGQSLWMKPVGHPEGARKYGITRMGVLPMHYEGDLSQLLVPLNPFVGRAGFRYDGGLGSSRWHVINDLIGQTVIDVHPHLVAAWQALLSGQGGCDHGMLVQQFYEPPVTAEQALELASFWRKDKIRAGRIANEWMTQAVQKYRRIQADALALSRKQPTCSSAPVPLLSSAVAQ